MQQWKQQNPLNIQYIDSHTHLLDYNRQSNLSLDKILTQSFQKNINHIACNTTCSKQFQHMQQLYLNNQYKQKINIIPHFGIHPCYICEENNLQQKNQWKHKLKFYLEKYPDAHVGEAGLDFRKDVLQVTTKEIQWQYFQYQFQLAIQMNRSITLHCVRAYGQLLKYLKKQNSKHSSLQISIILHSYGGSIQITKSLLKLIHLKIYFSLSLKHSPQLLPLIPLQKLLIQTDSPYQSNYQRLKEYDMFKEEKMEDNINSKKQLLKKCIFFNHNKLDNKPNYVVANYRSISTRYQVGYNFFCNVIKENAYKVFKIIKK